jgi:hypothetical protein
VDLGDARLREVAAQIGADLKAGKISTAQVGQRICALYNH